MLRSLYSGVSGLKTHQTKMDVIGNNIANVNTYGFKSSRVTFRDIYYQTLSGSENATTALAGSNATQIGYGTKVGSIDVIMSQSGYASTGQDMDCYIDGEGYFVVQDGSSTQMLTRVGTLGFDGEGNLIDGNKNYVCGYNVVDSSTTASLGNTVIDFGTANKSLLDGYTVQTVYAAAGTEGTAITANADEKTITVTYTPPTAESTKTLTNASLQTALSTQANWSWTTSDDTPTTFDSSIITVGSSAVGGAMTDAVTATSGNAAFSYVIDYSGEPEKIINSQSLINCAVGSDGSITGQNKEGKIVIIGQVALANVPNPQALTSVGDTYFQAVNNTGDITYSTPGSDSLGKLETGGLEMSNVDLTTEFSDMIMAQRGFQANSRIITVSDEMLEELVNLKR